MRIQVASAGPRGKDNTDLKEMMAGVEYQQFVKPNIRGLYFNL